MSNSQSNKEALAREELYSWKWQQKQRSVYLNESSIETNGVFTLIVKIPLCEQYKIRTSFCIDDCHITDTVSSALEKLHRLTTLDWEQSGKRTVCERFSLKYNGRILDPQETFEHMKFVSDSLKVDALLTNQ